MCTLFPLQLILFGLSNQLVVSYKEESTMAFKQLFIKNYGGEDEDDYSASVFTQQDFYNSVSYVMEQVGPGHSACLVWGCRCDFLKGSYWCLSVSRRFSFYVDLFLTRARVKR